MEREAVERLWFTDFKNRSLLEEPDRLWLQLTGINTELKTSVRDMNLTQLRAAVAEDLIVLLDPLSNDRLGGIHREELFRYIDSEQQKWRVGAVLTNLIKRKVICQHGNFIALRDNEKSVEMLWSDFNAALDNFPR